MLRKIVRTVTAAAATAAFIVGSATANIVPFNFTLDGLQEVPANNSRAVGAGQILFDTTDNTFSLDLMVFGITLADLQNVGPNGTPVHIHYGAPGQNGSIAVDVGWMSDFFEDGQGIRLVVQGQLYGGQQGNLFTDPVFNRQELFAGRMYINVHTQAFPGGEIRGNIPPIPAPAGVGLIALAGLLSSRRRRRH